VYRVLVYTHYDFTRPCIDDCHSHNETLSVSQSLGAGITYTVVTLHCVLKKAQFVFVHNFDIIHVMSHNKSLSYHLENRASALCWWCFII